MRVDRNIRSSCKVLFISCVLRSGTEVLVFPSPLSIRLHQAFGAGDQSEGVSPIPDHSRSRFYFAAFSLLDLLLISSCRQLITTSAMIVDAYGINPRNSDGKLPWLLSVVAVASQNPRRRMRWRNLPGFRLRCLMPKDRCNHVR